MRHEVAATSSKPEIAPSLRKLIKASPNDIIHFIPTDEILPWVVSKARRLFSFSLRMKPPLDCTRSAPQIDPVYPTCLHLRDDILKLALKWFDFSDATAEQRAG